MGQAAKDTQFGTDIGRIADVLLGDEDGNQMQKKTLELARMMGSSVSGVLRPLDALNSIIGFCYRHGCQQRHTTSRRGFYPPLPNQQLFM